MVRIFTYIIAIKYMYIYLICLHYIKIIFSVCQKIIQNLSTKHFPRDAFHRTAENDIKFVLPVITKNAQVYNKEVETTNSLKVSQNCSATSFGKL